MPYSRLSRRAKPTEADMQAEKELRKTMQQFHMMVEARKIYDDRAQYIIRHQKKEYNFLNQEHKDLTSKINMTSSIRNIAKDSKNVLTLRTLLANKDIIDEEIKEKRALIAMLDSQIRVMEGRITKQKNVMTVIKSAQQTVKKNKRIRTLEAQLHLTTIRFDETLTDNAKLREEIGNLQRTRAAFSRVYQGMLRQLHLHKATISTAIEESSRAFDERAEAAARITALKERRAKDNAAYRIELAELLRSVDHEKKIKEFMKIKGSERLEFGEAEIRKKREALAEEKAKKVKGDIFETYQAVHDQLVQETGESDIDVLIEEFSTKESQNFATFTYINEMHTEVDRLYAKIQSLEDELTNLQTEHRESKEDRNDTLKVLEVSLQKITEEANRYQQENKQSCKTLDQLMLSIEHLFKAISCDPTVIHDLLGGAQGITHATMMLYFSIIEQKANELMRIEALTRFKESEDQELDDITLNPFLGGVVYPRAVSPIKAPVPVIVEEVEPEEADISGEPIGLEAMRAAILESIIKKEQGEEPDSEKMESKLRDRRRAAVITESSINTT